MEIAKTDITDAAQKGVITNQQADALWAFLNDRAGGRVKFDLIHVAYYCGAMLVIGAMSWFMTEAWEIFGGAGLFALATLYAVGFVIVGAMLWRRDDFKTPGGLLMTMAVCMVPIAIAGLQLWLGIWHSDEPLAYRDFYTWIRGEWFAMEMATILAGCIAIYFIRFPFLTAPIGFALWYLSMDVTPILFADEDGNADWHDRRLVSVWFGFFMLFGSYLIDRRTKADFAFWGYLFGLIAFWSGLTFTDATSEAARFGYFIINVGLVGLAVFLRREIFILFGAIGIAIYLGHLAHKVFEDSLLFPFALTVLGLFLLYGGIVLKRNQKRLAGFIDTKMPAVLKRLRPHECALYFSA
jgi:hypothetical protein